jgi:hypothetical protein
VLTAGGTSWLTKLALDEAAELLLFDAWRRMEGATHEFTLKRARFGGELSISGLSGLCTWFVKVLVDVDVDVDGSWMETGELDFFLKKIYLKLSNRFQYHPN